MSKEQDKLPAFQFYPGDWKNDNGIRALSFHDRAIWFEMLLMMHVSPVRGKLILNGRAMTDEEISHTIGIKKRDFLKTLANIFSKGVASKCEETGAIFCRRMVRDEELRKVRKASGKLGGNPFLVNQPANQNATKVDSGLNRDANRNATTRVKQKPTPSSSSSSSSSVIKPPPTPPTALVVDTDVGGGDKESSGRTAAAHILQSFTQATGIKAMVTQKRIAAVRERIRDPVWRENWMKALEIASQMPALFGDNDRNWVMNVEWFLRPDTVAKILEGFYDNWSRTRTKAERHEQVTANAFQRIRDAIAADAAAGCEEGWSIPDGTGTTLFLKEHAATDGSSG